MEDKYLWTMLFIVMMIITLAAIATSIIMLNKIEILVGQITNYPCPIIK